jgi:peptidoglycan L-alanyl-D-glutamate endopeptidase CwlK
MSNKLYKCHPKLIKIVEQIRSPFVVVCGYRGEEDQNKAYAIGNSQVNFPHSKHNKQPSEAVDLAPININNQIEWDNIAKFIKLANEFLGIAEKENTKIIWGGNFKTLKDYGHFEMEVLQ